MSQEELSPVPGIEPEAQTIIPPSEISTHQDTIRTQDRISNRNTHPPIWMKDFVSLNIHANTPYALKYIGYQGLSYSHQAFIAALSSVSEPSTYSQTIKDPRWVIVMQEEIKALENNHTREIVSLPHNKKPIGCK